MLFGGYTAEVNDNSGKVKQKQIKMSYAWNSFYFEFASPVYAEQSNIEYSYLSKASIIIGRHLQKRRKKEYSQFVRPGTYKFKVKSKE